MELAREIIQVTSSGTVAAVQEFFAPLKSLAGWLRAFLRMPRIVSASSEDLTALRILEEEILAGVLELRKEFKRPLSYSQAGIDELDSSKHPISIGPTHWPLTAPNQPTNLGVPIFLEEDRPIVGARIKVIGIGGGGGKAINRMIESGMEGIEFIAANTDLQALKRSKAPIKIQLGSTLTKGLGAGANPGVGREAALEDTDKIIEVLEGADMVFVITGLGGGTGTGGAPIIASLATELNALTVAVVTKPFHFEGRRRMQQAEQGLRELRECVDTVISIPSESLFHGIEKSASLDDTFGVVDDVLRQAVQGISDLITVPGLINLDFADVRAMMKDMGMALMGVGRGRGENRVREATQQAISSPLFDQGSIQSAKGMLINITGGSDITLDEVASASTIIREAANEDANIFFAAMIDENLRDELKITLIITGVSAGGESQVASSLAHSERRPATHSEPTETRFHDKFPGRAPRKPTGLNPKR